MYYTSVEYEKLAIVPMKCSLCNSEANVKIQREVEFTTFMLTINFWWYGKIIGTCGNCHESFKLEKSDVYSYLEANNIFVKRSNITKNLFWSIIPIATVGILFYIFD